MNLYTWYSKLNYSKKLYLQAQAKSWGFIVFLIVAVFVYFKFFFDSQKAVTTQSIEVAVIFVTGFLFYPVYVSFLRKLTSIANKFNAEADAAKMGFGGEDIVAEWLIKLLPEDQYSVLRNATLPDHVFDIDFVVVGPKGVIVLEVKNYTNRVKFAGDKYLLLRDGKETLLPREDDPREQVKRHAEYLRLYFENNNLHSVRILKAVVFPKNNAASVDGASGVWIAGGLDSLKKFLDGITDDNSWTPELQTKIKELLLKK